MFIYIAKKKKKLKRQRVTMGLAKAHPDRLGVFGLLIYCLSDLDNSAKM